MLKRISRLLLAAAMVIVLSLAFSACQSPASTTTSSTASIPYTGPTAISPDLIQVVSMRGPRPPINPGGPIVEITLRNVSAFPVTALTAALYLNQTFHIKFDVSSANPLLRGMTISARWTLIGAGFSETESYPLVIGGVLEDGEIFNLNKQVQIMP